MESALARRKRTRAAQVAAARQEEQAIERSASDHESDEDSEDGDSHNLPVSGRFTASSAASLLGSSSLTGVAWHRAVKRAQDKKAPRAVATFWEAPSTRRKQGEPRTDEGVYSEDKEVHASVYPTDKEIRQLRKQGKTKEEAVELSD